MHIRSSAIVLALVVAAVLSLPSAADATTRYVATNGSDTAGSGTLASPYRTVQKAIAVSSAGDVVRVGAGTFAGGIEMKDGVSLEATGAGSGIIYTALSGTGGGSAVVLASGIGAATRLRGFRIEGATAGWGIYCTGSSPAITDNYVTANLVGVGCYASSAPTISANAISDNTGDGVMCNASAPKIVGNDIRQNHANGVVCTATASPIVADNYIGSNWSGARGVKCDASAPTVAGNDFGANTVGVECLRGASPDIIGNTFTGNNGPASVRCSGSSPVIEDNTINSSTGDAIACWAGSSATITGNTLSGNTDGIYCDYSSPTITDCTITGTSATSGTGIECQYSTPVISDVTVTTFSHGVWFNYSSPTITRSEMSGNWQGLFGRATAATITNCLVRGNVDGLQFDSVSTPWIINDTLVANSGTGIKCQLTDTLVIKNCILWNSGATELTNCSASYSDVLGGAPGTGNLNVDPLFVNPTGGDFHLSAASACINAGTQLDAPTIDKDGVPRPQFAAWDMGAYEYHPATCRLHYDTADANGSIVGVATQVLSFLGSGSEVTALPVTGFHFVEWSDHSTTNPRTDTEVASDATYTASFAINTYTCAYVPGAGGSIEGSATQVLTHGSSATSVTAVANAGYVFVGWSDGIMTPERRDTEVTADLTAIAEFVRPTTLTLGSGSVSSLAYGGAFAVTGTLQAADVGVEGQRVILQSATASAGPFADTAFVATTTAGGVFGFSVKPTSKTYYRVRFARAGGYGESGPTAWVCATPKAYVGTPKAPTTMYRTKYYTVYGYLKPRHTSGSYPVRIYKYRYVSGHWRTYGYVKAKASNYSSYTKYSVKMRLPYAGKWYLLAKAPADSGHALSVSSGHDHVTVR